MTTRLKHAIEDLLERQRVPARPAIEPAILQLARELPEGAADLPFAKNYDEISVRLAGALERGERLTKMQARDAAWCLWDTEVAISERSELLQFFLVQLRALKHKGASRALALSYLISFQADAPGFSAVAATLQDLAPVMGEPFEELHRKLRIFDQNEGPRRIGDASFKQRKPPRVILEEHGMRMEQVLTGGYVEPCARRVLERAAGDQRLPPFERLEFIQLVAVKGDTRQLNFPSHKDLLANALLLPYRNSDVDKAIRDQTLDFLISLDGLGDPRAKSGNWVNAPDARDVAIAWLTEQALRQFLDVVEAVNPNENWRYRRRFWEAMHVNGVIREAWVVLDSVGAGEARRRFGRNTRMGQFRAGGGIQAGHAVLLLRIGRGVCAEWSFSGQCRFWLDAEHQGAPKLYQGTYDAEFLRTGRRYAPVVEIRHSSHNGSNAWQHKAARQIAAMTGERLSKREYML
ncbi:EH signature domain-containing protein [Mesorhizobium sp. GR13]|uniref:EH signature domain-containing protein n=1 Tax=Mesorhizobium sp. GR13 TaxID=2562308 RepID=UPI0014857861|nr:EH signature domain-containing protein [Mesorhizobium sp. GR13]